MFGVPFAFATSRQADKVRALGERCCELSRFKSQWRLKEIRLSSSAEARTFYEHYGFRPSGDAVSAFGVLVVYPYVKALDRPPDL